MTGISELGAQRDVSALLRMAATVPREMCTATPAHLHAVDLLPSCAEDGGVCVACGACDGVWMMKKNKNESD